MIHHDTVLLHFGFVFPAWIWYYSVVFSFLRFFPVHVSCKSLKCTLVFALSFEFALRCTIMAACLNGLVRVMISVSFMMLHMCGLSGPQGSSSASACKNITSEQEMNRKWTNSTFYTEYVKKHIEIERWTISTQAFQGANQSVGLFLECSSVSCLGFFHCTHEVSAEKAGFKKGWAVKGCKR